MEPWVKFCDPRPYRNHINNDSDKRMLYNSAHAWFRVAGLDFPKPGHVHQAQCELQDGMAGVFHQKGSWTAKLPVGRQSGTHAWLTNRWRTAVGDTPRVGWRRWLRFSHTLALQDERVDLCSNLRQDAVINALTVYNFMDIWIRHVHLTMNKVKFRIQKLTRV